VEGPYILPGFIDLHVHGGAGWDTMAGEEGIRGMARFHLAHGTTALLPTTVTAPPEDILRALEGIRRAMEAGRGEARILGAHLEGPFISPRRLGAQPPSPGSRTWSSWRPSWRPSRSGW
jgi:N-acetylglucosamine-6-phosphate deacetylase